MNAYTFKTACTASSRFVVKYCVLVLMFGLMALPRPGIAEIDDSRGLVKRKALRAQTSEGKSIELYAGSHALLIGASRYSVWSELPSIGSELDEVARALEETGFEVHRLEDPDASSLKRGIEDFINSYGYDPENRLLFYFSGHGFTVGDKGFLLPVDIPLPDDRQDFRRKALPMTQVLAWAKDMEAKHVLFVFDSCFSGSVFKSKNMPSAEERYIRDATARPVRQFITAGSANEEVPATSTFTPAFVSAIRGEGDLNKDGYITGSELGVHLAQLVPRFVDQTPQYGKIREYDLSRGDFVFFSPDSIKSPAIEESGLNDAGGGVLPSTTNMEAMLWRSAEQGNSEMEYLAYLDSYPRGIFAPLAKARVHRLKSLPAPQKVKKFEFEPEMVKIPAGSFAMGSDTGRSSEQPVHVVKMNAFEMSRYEITFDEFDAYTTSIASERVDDSGWGRGRKPVINVSWDMIQSYVNWLNAKTGKDYRLPNEAEWEYAARAGSTLDLSIVDELSVLCEYGNIADDAEICVDGYPFLAEVGKFNANDWGLHDMYGNVREWTDDCWHDNYVGAPSSGYSWKSGGNCGKRVVRGGAWYSKAPMQSISVRNKMRTRSKGNGTGFRLVRNLM